LFLLLLPLDYPEDRFADRLQVRMGDIELTILVAVLKNRARKNK
jgi:hypothetical protein